MALKIRLARAGAKKHPFYKMVVADSRNPRDGSFVEKVGTYNPFLSHDDSTRITVNAERIQYWISVGAKPSDRVNLLLSKVGICKKAEINETPNKSAPKKKAQERLKAAAAAQEAAGNQVS